MISSSGMIHYSPQLLGDSSSKWWLVLWCDDKQLAKYYRHLYYLDQNLCHKLQRPAWDSHITVIRDEEPPDAKKHLWGTHEGEPVEFSYSPEVLTDGEYWWLPVISEQLLEFREELGLARQPFYPLHFSIGHTL